MNLKTFAVKLDDVTTDVTIGQFNNRVLIFITQTKKFGSIIRVEQETFPQSTNTSNILNLQTVFGKDSFEDHLFVRILCENIQIRKPLIFILNLKNRSQSTVDTLIALFTRFNTW